MSHTTPILRFAIFGNTFQAKKSVSIQKLLVMLEERNAEIFIDKEFHDYISREFRINIPCTGIITDRNFDADFAISLGGDGTFLKAAAQVRDKCIPIVGINMGRLGFMADVPANEIEEMVKSLYNGEYQVESRSVLQIKGNGSLLNEQAFALNEIAILKRDNSSMISIRAAINGEHLNVYQADGLIFCTPTGSTGYSLSVGGPIIVPQSHTFCLTPVAPHSLNVRPLIVCDDTVLTLKVESRSHNFLVAIDGRNITCNESVTLTLQKAPYEVKVVKRKHQSFFNTLKQKLMWGADIREEQL